MSDVGQLLKDNPYIVLFFCTSVTFLVLWLTKSLKKEYVGVTDKCVGQTTLCIDTRFQAPMQNYFKNYYATPYFNNYIVPGVTLALLGTQSSINPTGGSTAVGGGISTLNYMRAWVSSMAIARTLHSITSIAFMDHEDCGYFKAYFNGPNAMSYSNLSDPSIVGSWPGGKTYAQLTSVEQKQTHYYYLEQVKKLWGNGLLNSTTDNASGLMNFVSTGGFTSSQAFTGVELHTFYIDLKGNVDETGKKKVCV
jgi:hypothetical protein